MDFDDVRVLTFDVVGTLIDFETGILECLRPIADKAGSQAGDVELLETFARAEDVQQHLTPQAPFTQMLEPIYRRLAAELGLPAHGAEPAALRESIPRWPAFPDSREALAELGQRFRLVALTNADTWALGHMSAALGSPFHDAVTAEDVGVNKPDPQVFAYCRGRQSVYGYIRDEWLHVAQSQYHDIAAAKELGFRTCWIERRTGQAGYGATPAPPAPVVPDLHLSSMAELAEAARVVGPG